MHQRGIDDLLRPSRLARRGTPAVDLGLMQPALAPACHSPSSTMEFVLPDALATQSKCPLHIRILASLTAEFYLVAVDRWAASPALLLPGFPWSSKILAEFSHPDGPAGVDVVRVLLLHGVPVITDFPSVSSSWARISDRGRGVRSARSRCATSVLACHVPRRPSLSRHYCRTSDYTGRSISQQ